MHPDIISLCELKGQFFILVVVFSKAKTAPKAEVDYIERKFVKKPAGAKPGFVIYHTNYSLVASPDISSLKLISGGE